MNGPYTNEAGHVVHIWDFWTWGFGVAHIKVHVESGSADLGVAVLDVTTLPYSVSRSNALVLSDENGPGGDEEVVFFSSFFTVVGVVVWSNDEQEATYMIETCEYPPPPPVAVQATDTDCEEITVAWQDSSVDEYGFRIYRDGLLVHTTGPDETSWSHTPPPGTYEYSVSSFNLCGESPHESDTGTRPVSSAGLSNVSLAAQISANSTWSTLLTIFNLGHTCTLLFQITESETPSGPGGVARSVYKKFHWTEEAVCMEDVPWLDAQPTYGTIDPGSNESITVTFDSNGLEVGRTYDGYLQVHSDATGEDSLWVVHCQLTVDQVGITEPPGTAQLPTAYSLSQNYPNPFNPSTTIEYAVPGDMSGSIEIFIAIYDARGRLIRMLVDEGQEPGYYAVHWDGRDGEGCRMNSGVYLVRFQAGGFSKTRKMILLK